MQNKKRLLIIIGIIILVIGVPVTILLLTQPAIFRLRASENTQPKNVAITNIVGDSATITWTTNTPVQASVNYGLTEDDLSLVQPDSASTLNHQITLTNLLSERNYYFVIKVGNTEYRNNNNRAFVFTTKAKENGTGNEITPTPTLKLTPSATPTTASESGSVVTEAQIKAALGTTNTKYDVNKDGIVNSLDLNLWRNKQR